MNKQGNESLFTLSGLQTTVYDKGAKHMPSTQSTKISLPFLGWWEVRLRWRN